MLAELSVVVEQLEGEKPGRFGPNGARGQAVRLYFYFTCYVIMDCLSIRCGSMDCLISSTLVEHLLGP